MLFPQRFWAGLSDGSVTVAFRRWRRPTVRAGGTLQSPGGLLAIEAVDAIEPDAITNADARRAGYRDRHEALAELRPDGTLYRIRFRRAGEDPRIALRATTDFEPAELTALARRLERLDWAIPTLRLIADNPGTVSTDLAAQLDVERYLFKQRVRRLKALGLTESLKIGYVVSPRGTALLAALSRDLH